MLISNGASINLIFSAFGQAIANFWWLIFPIMLYFIFKIIWVDYVAFYSPGSWHKSQEWTYLELIPPREIERGPKPMESFFQGITSVLTTYSTFQKYLAGAMWHDRFSLEIVGEEGKIHFIIRTQKKHRNMIEAQIYAQYPDAEIREVPDYTESFPKVIPNIDWTLWGSDLEFVAPGAYPIKTYDKFEESITGEMIDPMAALMEVLGTLGPGEHAWLQFVIQPLPEKWGIEKEQKKIIEKLTGRGSGEIAGLASHIGDVFSNLIPGLFAPPVFNAAAKKDEAPLEFRLTPIEKDILKAVEDNLGKNFFSSKIRLLYIARKEIYDSARVGSIFGAIKQFNEINYNQFKPDDTSKTYGNYLFKKQRLAFRQRKIYNRYKNRNMDGTKLPLSVKELATIFHFPDMGVKSPATPRTAAKLGSAPANLPISE
jgi:hypothetical protein